MVGVQCKGLVWEWVVWGAGCGASVVMRSRRPTVCMADCSDRVRRENPVSRLGGVLNLTLSCTPFRQAMTRLEDKNKELKAALDKE